MDALTRSGTGAGRHPALARVSAILFDKDGTLLDFDATWGPATFEVLLELAGGDRAVLADLSASCGFVPDTMEFRPASPIIGGHTDDFAPAWAARLGCAYDDAFAARVDGLFRPASLRHLTPYDDVLPAIARLDEAGLPVGLATNDSEAAARAHLGRMGVLDRFAFVAGYDSGHGAKPGGGMVEAFARAVGVPAARVALVGDSPHDMQAASAAGAVAVGIARTAKARYALGATPPLVVSDLSGLLAALAL